MESVDAGAPAPLLAQVRQLIDAARQRVASAVNAELTQLYWHIGRRISTELLQGQRGEYGKQVVAGLARQLTAEFGKGWGERQLRYCVRVAEVFPEAEILHTLCSELSWPHLRLLIQIDDSLQRDFYIEICRVERWSVRQLQERINSMLFYHRRLRRLVAIDLKISEFEATYKGQMELYLRYLEKHEQMEGEATPHRPHPVHRQKPRARRTAATAPKQHPRGRLSHSAATARNPAGQTAPVHCDCPSEAWPRCRSMKPCLLRHPPPQAPRKIHAKTTSSACPTCASSY
ncbi:PDDEXK nuclease domain-containing protein [Simplicispira hankyongi]|uniref:PDDEXK nuclease domain-containing protein n=1 Tax=Simplicispira hankyongi TaxID=2315688 RepID=UPI003CCC5AFF